ncbi:MAG TPA: glutamyl-tRNA reductase, partial [Candidatus Acidoferrum sp.]|nr:glutamyl-tRNA reductase [Candidatus Acidoferrum sp.]
PPEDARQSADALASYLSSFHSVEIEAFNASLYRHYDREAVRHLFRVASGLDSMLIGEAEILGQVREAYRAAHGNGGTGPVLNRMFQGALEVGKRVRSETELGTRPMSVASAGVKLAERIFGKLNQRTALVLGAGTIGEQVISQLRDREVAHLYVMNRSADKAELLAREFGGKVVPWGDWDHALQVPDLIVSSVSADDPVLLRDTVKQAMAARKNRALMLIDLGMPRNIDASLADLYNVYLYNLDDLTEIVRQNRAAREEEIPRAEDIVDEHVTKFLSWQASVELVGLLDVLRSRVKEERAAFLREKMEALAQFRPEEREKMELLMDELLEKILMRPAEKLRGEKRLQKKIQNVDALRDLFLNDREKR